jgi:hypothetical protein
MADKNQLTQAAQKLRQAKTCLVLLSQSPSVDMAAAALALFLSLEAAKKSVQIGCPTEMSVAYNRLFGVDKIKTKVGSKNLVVSFPYIEESIEKVSYHVQGKTFNLVIVPKKGQPFLDPAKVSYASSGIEADVVLVIGAQKWEDLGQIYEQERDVFINLESINMGTYPTNTQFGTINLTDPTVSSHAEIVGQLLRESRLTARDDVATNLIAGIESATNNLQNRTSAATFSLLSWLMRGGGKRGHLAGQPGASQPMPRPAFPGFPMPFVSAFGQAGQAPQAQAFPQMPPTSPLPQPDNQQPVVLPQAAPPIRQESEATDTATEGEENQEEPTQASPDWFKPNIYKGNTRV